jgi:hypothetical protein
MEFNIRESLIPPHNNSTNFSMNRDWKPEEFTPLHFLLPDHNLAVENTILAGTEDEFC